MKAIIFLFFLTIIGVSCAQGVWTAKADFPGVKRVYAVAFSIGDKGYYGTGQDSLGNNLKDFWEYNSLNDTWTQLTDFGGVERVSAVGFAANGKGYIGTGNDGIGPLDDFWEYNPSNDTWTQIADMPGNQRNNAVAFAIGDTGYVVTGYDGFTWSVDMWAYDAIGGSWSQKTDFVGSPRIRGVGFAVGNIGFVTTGHSSGSNPGYTDTWKYDPLTDSWSAGATWTTPRHSAAGFGLSVRGYVFTGYESSLYVNSCYEFNPGLSTMTQVADAGNIDVIRASGFSIGDIGYLVGGQNSTGFESNLWEYAPEWLSTKELSISNATIYPNPTTDIVNIRFEDNKSRTISIIDPSGRVIQTITTGSSQNQLNVSGYNAGMYIIRIIGENLISSKRLIIE